MRTSNVVRSTSHITYWELGTPGITEDLPRMHQTIEEKGSRWGSNGVRDDRESLVGWDIVGNPTTNVKLGA
jgi:hypothetical protein